MVSVKKSKKDGHLWFSDIKDPEKTVLPHLLDLESEQAVELRVDGAVGIWLRFSGVEGKIPPALKRGNADAKRIWKKLNGVQSVSLDLVRVLSIDESRKYSKRRGGHVEFTPLKSKYESNVLCLGVDVAWWGGGGGFSDYSSRTETIAYAKRTDGNWSELSIKRVDLNQSYDRKADEFTPNSDPDAKLLVENILAIVDSQRQVDQVVLALDMPILAKDDGMDKPKKAYAEGEKGGAYRQCDLAWLENKKPSPAGWRNVNIMTGAPIAPRIKALLSQLEAKGFSIFGKTSKIGNKAVFECFPNEILWSVGVLGLAEGLNFNSLRLYKSIGKNKVPLPEQVFHALWKLPIELALTSAGLSKETISCWQIGFTEWLINDQTFDPCRKIGSTGKQFDDAIDSVLSLSAVVSFVNGRAHIHQGADPEDGHIIGCGLRGAGNENPADEIVSNSEVSSIGRNASEANRFV